MRLGIAALSLAIFFWVAGDVTPADQATPGAQQTVCGKVEKVTCESANAPRFTTLELKPKSKVPVTILPATRAQFNPPPEVLYRDTDVCATGRVETYGRQRRLVVSGPQDIAIRKQLRPTEVPFTSPYAVECDEGVETPVLIHEVKPNYTRRALEARIEGTVALEAIVNTEGIIGEVRVRRSLDSQLGLDDEAVTVVKQWRFGPGMRFGQPVPFLVQIELSFRLGQIF
jgi:TonB family protein